MNSIKYNVSNKELFSIDNITRKEHLIKNIDGTIRKKSNNNYNLNYKYKEWTFDEIKPNSNFWNIIFEQTDWLNTDNIRITGSIDTCWKYGTIPWDKINEDNIKLLPKIIQDEIKFRSEHNYRINDYLINNSINYSADDLYNWNKESNGEIELSTNEINWKNKYYLNNKQYKDKNICLIFNTDITNNDYIKQLLIYWSNFIDWDGNIYVKKQLKNIKKNKIIKKKKIIFNKKNYQYIINICYIYIKIQAKSDIENRFTKDFNDIECCNIKILNKIKKLNDLEKINMVRTNRNICIIINNNNMTLFDKYMSKYNKDIQKNKLSKYSIKWDNNIYLYRKIYYEGENKKLIDIKKHIYISCYPQIYSNIFNELSHPDYEILEIDDINEFKKNEKNTSHYQILNIPYNNNNILVPNETFISASKSKSNNVMTIRSKPLTWRLNIKTGEFMLSE
jgi:hypothetical protein